MQRRLRITLAVAVAAGVAVLGAGTAEAQDMFKSSQEKDCSRSVDKDKPLKETDFPSYGEAEADKNARRNDIRDRNGDLYYVHNASCDAPRPWRGWDWHDSSYDTFHNKRERGGIAPSQKTKQNSYMAETGYNDGYDYDVKKLDRDHIGVKKNPKYATE